MIADLFTQQPAADPIGAATKRGATFERIEPDGYGNTWTATAHKRGRPVPLVVLKGSTQEAAADAFCHFFHAKA